MLYCIQKALRRFVWCIALLIGLPLNAYAVQNNIVNQDVPEIAGAHIRVATTNNCQGDLMAFIAFPANAFDQQHPEAINAATSWALHAGLSACPQATRMQIIAGAGGKTKETAEYDGIALASNNWQPTGRFTTPYHYGAVIPQTTPASPSATGYGVPAEFQEAFSQAETGKPFWQTRENAAFLAAVAYAIVDACNTEIQKTRPNDRYRVPEATGEYAVSGMVMSTQITESSAIQQMFGPFSTLYPKAQQGTAVGKQMGCSAKGRHFLDTMNASVVATEHDSQGGPSQFMRTCPSKIGSEMQCFCFARAARAIEPNIFQERFSMYDYNKLMKGIQMFPAIQMLHCQMANK